MNGMAASGASMPALRGIVRHAEPMRRHTVWAVGGPAERFYEPADLDDLATFLNVHTAPEGALFWFGLGSNLLVRDGGVAGTVIKTVSLARNLECLGDRCVRVGAGVPCAKLARFCASRGLAGSEFLAGIPGTLGGALAMNAGAHGGQTWELVRRVQTMDRHGRRRFRAAGEFHVSYRSVAGAGDEWFVQAELELEPGDAAQATARIRTFLQQRNASQPMGQRSCGSVFRNPPDDYAGRLIEASGLKGLRVGGAVVSTKHANFILNTGDATATDIEALIDRVGCEVERLQGIRLVPEVRIVGRAMGHGTEGEDS